MPTFFPLAQLEVIGCTEVPVLQPAMPRVLSPIYAERGTATVLFPPYVQDGEILTNPAVSTREEFDDLCKCGDILPRAATPAMIQWDLWLDDSGQIHYEPASLVRKKLEAIYQARYKLAELAYKNGAWAGARDHARVARSANPHKVDPLIIRAAAERKLGNAEELRLTVHFANTLISPTEFLSAVDNWVKRHSVAEKTGPTSRFHSSSSMKGCASLRPRPSPQLAYA